MYNSDIHYLKNKKKKKKKRKEQNGICIYDGKKKTEIGS